MDSILILDNTCMEYDLRQLRYFVTIAEAGSFSAAGLELGVAQSALSHHIAQMEGRLGVTLFERSSKGITLTESGRRFLEHAHAILTAVDAATNDVRDDAREPGGLVRIGITLTVAPALIKTLMARLNKEAPRVTLRVEERLSPSLVQAVSNGETDIAICFNAGDDRRVRSTALFEEDICLVGAPSLVGHTNTGIRLEEALGYPLLLPGRDHMLRGMIDRMTLFRNHPIEVRHECLSLHSLHSGLELGLGATLISKFSALPLWRQNKVVCRPIVNPNVTRQLCIASNSERPVTTAQKVVMDIVASYINEAVVGGDWPDTRLITAQG